MGLIAQEATTREAMVVHCRKCGHEWAPCFCPVPIDIFVKVSKRPCPSCGSRQVFHGAIPRDTAEGDALGWLTHGDTGTSSLTIWHVLMRQDISGNRGPGIPQDPDDFGRCYRLLKIMPSWRARLGEVSERYPHWKPLVSAWDELTALYEAEVSTGRCEKLYGRMRELLGDRGE